MKTRKVETLKDLYINELKDLYDAENRILKGLSEMEEKANDPSLKTAFREHRSQTENQVNRLERIFSSLDESPKGKTCEAAKGLIEEAQEIVKEVKDPDVEDAGLIIAAQKVEHYEIAGYGSVHYIAQMLGLNDQASLLAETLNEEEATDDRLNEIAKGRVNQKAAAHA